MPDGQAWHVLGAIINSTPKRRRSPGGEAKKGKGRGVEKKKERVSESKCERKCKREAPRPSGELQDNGKRALDSFVT